MAEMLSLPARDRLLCSSSQVLRCWCRAPGAAEAEPAEQGTGGAGAQAADKYAPKPRRVDRGSAGGWRLPHALGRSGPAGLHRCSTPPCCAGPGDCHKTSRAAAQLATSMRSACSSPASCTALTLASDISAQGSSVAAAAYKSETDLILKLSLKVSGMLTSAGCRASSGSKRLILNCVWPWALPFTLACWLA